MHAALFYILDLCFFGKNYKNIIISFTGSLIFLFGSRERVKCHSKSQHSVAPHSGSFYLFFVRFVCWGGSCFHYYKISLKAISTIIF